MGTVNNDELKHMCDELARDAGATTMSRAL
jgi:hypothetical protein